MGKSVRFDYRNLTFPHLHFLPDLDRRGGLCVPASSRPALLPLLHLQTVGLDVPVAWISPNRFVELELAMLTAGSAALTAASSESARALLSPRFAPCSGLLGGWRGPCSLERSGHRALMVTNAPLNRE